jgi:acetyl-CoA synthetase
MSQVTIESTLQEKRLFHPSAEFSQNAHIKSLEDYQRLYELGKLTLRSFGQN